MPGVTITTATRSGPAASVAADSAAYFAVGLTERGPIDRAVECRSFGAFQETFGARPTFGNLWDDIRTYFEEDGARVYISRVVGPAAAVSSRTLNDRAVAPLPTLRIDAANPGAWGTSITVEVADGAAADTFTMIVRRDGVEVARYADLTSPAEAAAAAVGSPYIRVTNLGSATAAPANNPAVTAATALAGGNDDRAAVTAVHVVAALDDFVPELGAGVVAAPGWPAASVADGLKAHAGANSRIALTSVAPGSTPAQAIAAAAAIVGENLEHIGLVYPAVRIPDGGVIRTITPEGYVAAARVRAIRQLGGPWRAPGGEISQARFIVGTDTPIDRATGDQLDAAKVSAVRMIANTTRLYGWRSLSADLDNYALLTARDTLNVIEVVAAQQLEPFVFRPIDGRGQLLSQIEAALIGIVEPIRAAGGLYELVDPNDGTAIDPGYSVDVGDSVNPRASLQQNRIAAVIAARPSPTATLIELTVVRVAVSALV